MFKNPELGRAEAFENWFKNFPHLSFILAHMNFHQPDIAMDLAEKHSNIYLETSWQPTEVIGEAVRRIGPERILYGSDWPFVGDNINVGIKRIQSCVEAGMFSDEAAELIFGMNALKLFQLQTESE
jgi:predicted TIM-barrel fold metal-dependent hydrolase